MPVKPLRRAVGAERERDDFLWSAAESLLDLTLLVPDPIEFSLSSAYLGKPLYPRQGTVLKCMFLRTDLLTGYDYEVIAEWEWQWQQSGEEGTPPGLLDRMEACRAEGRRWFRDTLNISGRRSGKNHIGGIGGSYVTWHYLALGNPQYHYGIDQDKHLAMFVFAAKKEMAMRQQWADLASTILGAQCFRPYLTGVARVDELRLYTQFDRQRIADRHHEGVAIRDEDMASIEIMPKESTLVSARGPALFALVFDEMAHVTRQVARASAEQVWDQATPALDQFHKDGWIYEPSSPEAKTGQFYANSVEAQRISDGSEGIPVGLPARPDIFVLQLASWEIYKDWEIAHTIPLRPGEPECYPRQRQAVQEYDDQMRRLERANPQKFNVERRSRWASVADAYLHAERVDAAFEPWPNEERQMNVPRDVGSMAFDYVMHIDPSKVGDNTGLCIAHAVKVQGDLLPHVITDVVGHWAPGDFVDNGMEIDYNSVLGEIIDLIGKFLPSEVSFDQGPSSGMMMQTLRTMLGRQRLPKQVRVLERTATMQSNWAVAETTKVALQMGCLHLIPDELLRNELLFLQLVKPQKVDHPTSGPVQSKDVFDALSQCVHALIGKDVARMMGDQFTEAGILPGAQGGFPLPVQAAPVRGDYQQYTTPVGQVAASMQSFQRGAAKARLRSGQRAPRRNW
jgi:hypothetical protein